MFLLLGAGIAALVRRRPVAETMLRVLRRLVEPPLRECRGSPVTEDSADIQMFGRPVRPGFAFLPAFAGLAEVKNDECYRRR
jgi:hypothetical protein